ncbi:MAG: ribonuclease Z [Candidatus Omnitrophota bacterium]
MAKVVFLGTSSSIPTKGRDNTSFLFTGKKETFLIDCPGSICQKLLKAGYDFRKLRNIIITHEHPDHIYGLVSLIHTQAYFNKILNIFTNSSCIRIINKLIKIFDLNRKHYPAVSLINVFGKSSFYQSKSLILSAIRNKHVRSSFGIRFDFGKKTLLYSSDTALSDNIIKQASLADYLIHDCTASSYYFRKHSKLYKIHTCAKDLALSLEHLTHTRLIPIHFLLMNRNEYGRIRKELRPLGKRCIFAKDFDSLNL